MLQKPLVMNENLKKYMQNIHSVGRKTCSVEF